MDIIKTDFGNIHIISDARLTVTITEVRTWRDRLFTWPWNPRRKFNTRTVPDPNVYLVDGHMMGHPSIIARITNIGGVESV